MKDVSDNNYLIENGIDYIATNLGSLERLVLKSVARLEIATPHAICLNLKEKGYVNQTDWTVNTTITRLIKKNMLEKYGKYKGCTVSLSCHAKNLAINYLLKNTEKNLKK